ncbi:class I SAM-dependent methyltransferase, partial [Coxiella burnetii]|uniref:class I SAM-dependent methyltransferase n=1 Tax=Coxiella burnetii TaxID=777 RepID=UPI003F4AE02C
LDLAGGTGDLAKRISPLVGDEGEVVIADINAAMLNVGVVAFWIKASFEIFNLFKLMLKNCRFPIIFSIVSFIGFGLRNVTNPVGRIAINAPCYQTGWFCRYFGVFQTPH